MNETSGSCLCGKVKFTVSGEVSAFHLCHCSRCRKSTGSAHASNIFTSPENIQWLEGEDYIKRFELPSAQFFAKQFCTNCGSGLPYVNRSGTYLIIPAGSLSSDCGVSPEDNIYWDSRADWYDAGLTSKKCSETPE